MGKLSDCLTKAVKADLLTQEESDFVQRRAKEFPGMSAQDAEIAAARSMLQDGINELSNIRHQLGVAKPIAQSKVILRATNKEEAMIAMADETQAAVERQMIAQAKALRGDEAVVQRAEQKAEEGMLAPGGRTPPRTVDREAEITAALDRLNKKPEERIGVYQKIRDTLLRTMRANRIEIAGMEFERGMTPEERTQAGIRRAPEQHEIQREKMLSAMGELNAFLKFLPAEIRGKVGGFFQLAKGGMGETELADFFTQRIKMVEREVERLLRNDYTAQIEKLLARSEPKTTPSRVKKSKIGDSQAAVDIAREASEMTLDEAALELSSIEQAMANPELTDEQLSVLQGRYAIVNAFGDLRHRDAESLAAAHAWLKDAIARGRSEWQAKEKTRLDMVHGWQDEITQGLPETQRGAIDPLNLRQLADSFVLSHSSFQQFIEAILPEGFSAAKSWTDRARRGDNATQDMAIDAGDRLTESLQEAIGNKGRVSMAKAMWSVKEVHADKVTVQDKPLAMSKLEGIQYLLSWAQPDVRKKMEKDGWTQEAIDQVAALTNDPMSRAIAAFLRQEYARTFELLNPVYRRMYGMDMPHVENYAPTRYEHAGAEQEMSIFGGPLAVNGITPGFLKSRVSHSARLRQMDALTVYWQHLSQASQWANFAELTREMRGVFGKPEVKRSIEQKYGTGVAQEVTKWIDALARQGSSKASEMLWLQKFMDGIISAKAVSSLGLNLRTIIMQADSMHRFVFAMPTRRIVRALNDPKLIENISLAWHSDSVQRRVQHGSSPEARYLFDATRTRPSVMLELARLSMMPVQYADAYLTSLSSAVVYTDAYNAAIEQGNTPQNAEAIAAEQMDEAVYRFSQPMGTANRSLTEVSGNAFFRMFMLFMSDPRLKTAILAQATRGLATGKGDAATHWRRIAAIEAMSVFSQVLSNIYRDLFSDDEDEDIWTWQGFARALALPMLSGWFLIGTGLDVTLSMILGEKAFTPARDPFTEALQRAVRAGKNIEDVFNLDDIPAMVKEWDNVARAAVLAGPIAGPSAAGLAVVVNALKPLVGALENSKEKE